MKKLILIPLTFLIINVFGQVKKAEIIQLNENTIYYETYGGGEPLFFFHGYTQSSKYWLPYIMEFMNEYEVYLIDLPGHGNSGPVPENLSFKKIADQIMELTQYLGLEKIKAIGFSFGGDVLFNIAAYYPNLIESMVTIGGIPRNIQRDTPWMVDFLSYKNVANLPWVKAYQKNDDQTKKLLDLVKNTNSSLNDDMLMKISSKILMCYGDTDPTFSLNEVSRIRRLLPHSNLLIFPNSEHAAHEGKNLDYFIKKSKLFLKNQPQ